MRKMQILAIAELYSDLASAVVTPPATMTVVIVFLFCFCN